MGEAFRFRALGRSADGAVAVALPAVESHSAMVRRSSMPPSDGPAAMAPARGELVEVDAGFYGLGIPGQR